MVPVRAQTIHVRAISHGREEDILNAQAPDKHSSVGDLIFIYRFISLLVALFLSTENPSAPSSMCPLSPALTTWVGGLNVTEKIDRRCCCVEIKLCREPPSPFQVACETQQQQKTR